METFKDLFGWVISVFVLVIISFIVELITEQFDIAFAVAIAFATGSLYEYHRQSQW